MRKFHVFSCATRCSAVYGFSRAYGQTHSGDSDFDIVGIMVVTVFQSEMSAWKALKYVVVRLRN